MLIFKHRPKYFEFITCFEKPDLLPDKSSDLTSPKRRKFLRIDTLINMVKGSIVCSRYSCLVQYSGFYLDTGLDSIAQPYYYLILLCLPGGQINTGKGVLCSSYNFERESNNYS